MHCSESNSHAFYMLTSCSLPLMLGLQCIPAAEESHFKHCNDTMFSVWAKARSFRHNMNQVWLIWASRVAQMLVIGETNPASGQWERIRSKLDTIFLQRIPINSYKQFIKASTLTFEFNKLELLLHNIKAAMKRFYSWGDFVNFDK